MDNLHFLHNSILTKLFKELTKYKNDYQQYLNYICTNYIIHLNVYLKYIYEYVRSYKLINIENKNFQELKGRIFMTIL